MNSGAEVLGIPGITLISGGLNFKLSPFLKGRGGSFVPGRIVFFRNWKKGLGQPLSGSEVRRYRSFFIIMPTSESRRLTVVAVTVQCRKVPTGYLLLHTGTYSSLVNVSLEKL